MELYSAHLYHLDFKPVYLMFLDGMAGVYEASGPKGFETFCFSSLCTMTKDQYQPMWGWVSPQHMVPPYASQLTSRFLTFCFFGSRFVSGRLHKK